MEIELKAPQAERLLLIAKEKAILQQREKDLIDFILAGYDIDPAKVKSIELKDKSLIVEVDGRTEGDGNT